MNDLLTSEKEEKIANDTYTISFCHRTEDNKNLQEEKDKNGALFYEQKSEWQWEKILANMAKNMKDKTYPKSLLNSNTKKKQLKSNYNYLENILLHIHYYR